MGMPQYYASNLQDVGGLESEHAVSAATDAVDAPIKAMIEKSAKGYQYWEVECHAFYTLLLEKRLASAAAVRRSIENLPVKSFQSKTYYEKWAAALARVSLEKGTISQLELDEALGLPTTAPAISFKAGEFVRVKAEDSTARYRKPHLRTPGYLFGVVGEISDAPVYYLEEPDNSSYAQGSRGWRLQTSTT